MSKARPPIVATWLYDRLATGSAREAIVGDLIEQYAAGRSRLWYWRQILGAIVIDLATQLRLHRWIALRGLIVGWLVLTVLRVYVGRPVFTAAVGLRDAIGDWAFFSLNWHAPLGSILISQLVALPHSLAVWTIAITSAWILGRLHRKHQTVIVLLFALTVALEQSTMWLLTFRHMLITETWPISAPRWHAIRGLYVASAVQHIVATLCLVTVGLWRRRGAIGAEFARSRR